jgi:hypothetical protein
MKINYRILLIIIVILSICCANVEAFSNRTHKAISEKAIINSQADVYLKNQLGFSQGLGTLVLLDQGMIPAGERIPYAQFEARITPELPSNPCSILNFLKAGANLEDIPNPRARHHFHAPIANPGVNPPNPNSGLDNRTDHPDWADTFDFWTDLTYGLSFDLTGASAQLRASGTEGAQWETEYQNYYSWPDTRTYFYRAMTKSTLAQRNHYLALTFISLGQTAHLLEDMGVPAHTRNDFVKGHMRLRGINIIKDWGNPFEYWAEKQIKANDNNIPSGWLTGWSSQPKVFEKISKYWDTDLYEGTYIGLPSSAWGLAEQTNYQFLSTSTVFGCEGTLYQFPNPAESHTTLTSEQKIGYNKYLRYYQGYGLQHLARQTYSNYVSYGYSPEAITVTKKTITPDDDNNVYNDYVKITIPRTIDYTTGLINYFFRGKLSATPSCSNAECDPVEIYITNQSVSTNVNQTLKGGSFGLYWDDNSGNRTQVSGLTVYDSDDPARPNLWGPTTTLAKGSSIRATFNKPSTSVAKYTLVYRGSINANPNDPDPNDANALAVCTFDPPGPPRPIITNITPEMGCPGSILYIEGTGFSKTPSHNTVLFDDVNTGYPDVYGIVQQADSNGRWLKVQLPVFDAESVDYYWTNATVTADGNVSVPYPFQLTNYIWCTISIWDAGESVDDDFDVWVDGEYWFTSYQDPPNAPSVAEYGFWYEDGYGYVDVYLYQSHDIPGGTLGIIIEPYVTRVTAYRWDSISELREFLYDEDFDGTFIDYFGNDILITPGDPGDGVEMDVYESLTYTGSMDLTKTASITIPKEIITVGAGERQSQFESTSMVGRSHGVDIPRKRSEKGADHHRTRDKVRNR